MKITEIYDNGGRTLDRYTVITDQSYGMDMHITDGRPSFQALGLNEGGDGFSQWGEAQAGRHLGKKVSFESLSPRTQKHIAARVLGDE